MDELEKFLRKQSIRKRKMVIKLIDDLLRGDFENCSVVKLKGYRNLFRIRKGKIRVIFTKTKDHIVIKKVSFRNEETYKF